MIVANPNKHSPPFEVVRTRAGALASVRTRARVGSLPSLRFDRHRARVGSLPSLRFDRHRVRARTHMSLPTSATCAALVDADVVGEAGFMVVAPWRTGP